MPEDAQIVIEIVDSDLYQPDTAFAATNLDDTNSNEEPPRAIRVKLDKFLWAVRFFKTRALAKAAIERGKVLHNNAICKASVEISIGDTLYIRQGLFEKHVRILALSTRRRSIEEAASLYEEIIDLHKPKLSQYGTRQPTSNHPYKRFQHAPQYHSSSIFQQQSEQTLPHNKYQEEQYQYAQQQLAKLDKNDQNDDLYQDRTGIEDSKEYT